MRADPQRQHLAAMTLGAGRGEAGKVGHRDDGCGVSQLRRGGSPTGSEHHGHVVCVDAGALGHGGCCPPGFGRRIFHDSELSSAPLSLSREQ